MRVISGTAKGRALKAVPGMNTRPTTDKVKEAIFSMIGPYFEGGAALDLFAGTGGLGIEALSRGMEHVIFVDLDKKSIDTIRENLRVTNFSEQAEVYRNEALRAIKALGKRKMSFTLIFLDPPYRLTHVAEWMGQMEQHGLLEEGATILVEHDTANQYDDSIGNCTRQRYVEYGDTAISIYRYVPNKTS